MTRPQMGAAGMLALLVGLALTTVVPGVPGSVAQSRAEAAALHRAGLVVDPGDGSGPHTACVWFAEESISGLELLARSTFDAGVRAFGGLGGAVCSIDGAGCSTDSACLSCGGTQYWAYATANPGDTAFAEAPAGAGSRTVTDGAVDGWRWGSGDPPAFRPIDRICPASPPAPAPTAPPPPAPAPEAPTARPQAPVLPRELLPETASPVGVSTTTAVPSTSTSSTSVSTTVVASTASSSTSSSTSTSITIDPDAEPAATVAAAAIVPEADNDDASGGAGVLAIVAVALAAGLGVTAIWRLRRSS